MRNLTLFLTVIFLTSFVSMIEQLDGKPKVNPFNKIEDSSQYMGDWSLRIDNDPFDGKTYYSRVYAEYGSGSITVITDAEGRRNYINYRNGDGYICGNYSQYGSSLGVQHIFSKKDTDEEYKTNIGFSLSDSNAILISMLGSGTNYINLLNYYDKVVIRTKDTCGNQVTRSFQIEGTTHLIPCEE